MKRRELVKGLAWIGVASAFPFPKTNAGNRFSPPGACTLIPSETAGPFPLDLTTNQTFFRQTINETKTGTILTVKLRIIGSTNCLPMRNLRVNIWHCDKDGLYSGYDNSMNSGQAGLTYCRGYQITDTNGEVTFKTIFPGWYSGRLCHIHFQVYVSASYAAVSQLTFDVATKNAIYAAASTLYTKGADPLTAASDNVFSDGVSLQTATLTKDATGGGYTSTLDVTIQGTGTTGVNEVEIETGGQFKLGQNYPNPYFDRTTIPFKLNNAADVRMLLWDIQVKTVAEIKRPNLGVGEHQIAVNLCELSLPTGNYAYVLETINEQGVFHQMKLMSAAW